MTVLAPEDLYRLLGVPPEKIDCAGLRLTLAQVYRLGSRGLITRDHVEIPQYIEISPRDNMFRLEPGAYLVRYNEYIRVPENTIALAIQRSSLLRIGATLYTAVWDPGYEGRGAGLLVVHNRYGIELEKGTQIAQLVYIKMTRKTNRIYRGRYYGEG